MAIDTRTKHYTATVEVHEVTSSGVVSPTNYPNDGKALGRDSEQVSKVVLRSTTLEGLAVKVSQAMDSGAFF